VVVVVVGATVVVVGGTVVVVGGTVVVDVVGGIVVVVAFGATLAGVLAHPASRTVRATVAMIAALVTRLIGPDEKFPTLMRRTLTEPESLLRRF
jgi:hypothetical protein